MTSDDMEDRLSLLRRLDVTREVLSRVVREGQKADIEITKFISGLGLEGARGDIAARAFAGLDESGRLTLLQSWLSIVEMKTLDFKLATRVCVTGINPEGWREPVMDTAQAFMEVVSRAAHRIVVMGYRLNDGNERLMDALDTRMRKDGIQVSVVTDHLLSRIGGNDQRRLVKWLGDGTVNFRVWSFESKNDMELMHVKCMFADKSIAYVGSANFSYGGSKRNVELGLLVKDESVLSALDSIYMHLVSGSHRDMKQITYYDFKGARGQ